MTDKEALDIENKFCDMIDEDGEVVIADVGYFRSDVLRQIDINKYNNMLLTFTSEWKRQSAEEIDG